MEEQAPKVMESLLLSVSHFRSVRETANRQVELIERHFRQDEMLAALRDLATLVGLPAPKQRQAGASRTATWAQAEDVVAAIKQLGDEDKLPRFQVQSDDLPRVLLLLGAVSVGDERGVSARLEALEAAQRAGMDEMRRMVAVLARAPHPAPVPDIEVTSPTFARVVGGAAGTRVAPGMAQGLHPVYSTQQGGGSQQSRPDARTRTRSDRSTSNKRLREGEGAGEWREVTHQRGRKPRARPKAVSGTASLSEFNDLAGPEQFWIGNTRSSTDQAKMVEVLEKCAQNLGAEGFTVEDAYCLTKEDNPRTKSWKVSVPARFKELMANPAMYPQGWSHRPFQPGFRRQEGAAGRAADGRPAAERTAAVRTTAVGDTAVEVAVVGATATAVPVPGNV